MARREPLSRRALNKTNTSGFRLRGVYAAVDALTQTLAREAANTIGRELAELSPQYSGEFANHWVIEPGNVPIPATTPGPRPRPRMRRPRQKPEYPVAPSLRGTGITKATGVEYTIGNTMEYRDIAMDLKPGRVRPNSELSAPADWYIGYLNSPNGLRRAIQYASGLPVVEDAWVNARVIR